MTIEAAAVYGSRTGVPGDRLARPRRDLNVSDRFLRLVARRTTTHVIARDLGLSERTVERRLSIRT